ncbi:MAG: Branched-chain amino acid transporter, amino acid-binding protein [Candidatus Binatus sp.]|jgi:Galactose oxidase, central domain|nr:Branched-chain amino acid transporter, amino acid-binding protein [Candidatus Binatus sp.]
MAVAPIAALAFLSLIAASGCINGNGQVTSTVSASSDASSAVVGPHSVPAATPAAGDVLIAGGADGSRQTLAQTEFFDAAAGKFTVTGSSLSSRAGAIAVPITQDSVLVSGGFSGGASIRQFTLELSGKVLSSAEIFSRSSGSFTATNSMSLPRVGFTATPLNNGKILLVGGLDGSGNVLDTGEIYDPATLKFSLVRNTMTDRRAFHGATLLQGGKVLLTGGVTNLSGGTTNTADLYDPITNFFTPTNFSLDHARAAHSSTLLTSGPLAGDVLIAGGGGGSTLFLKDSTAEIYDPGPQQFVLLSSFLNEPRSMHSATMLDDGTVLLAGGFDGSVAVSGGKLSGAAGLISNSAEIFDPLSQEFTCIGGFNAQETRCNPSMSAARAGHTATLMTQGAMRHQVLITGGIGGSNPGASGTPLSSAEIFNPAGAGSFTKTAPMSVARAMHTATVLR